MSDLDRRLAALSPARRKLLELRLKKDRLDLDDITRRSAELGDAATPGAPEPLPRHRPEDGDPPLAPDQERIYFLHELRPENPFYNIITETRMRGHLDIARLRRALAALVERHENFRTRYVTENGRAVMKIEPHFAPSLPVFDLRHLPHGEAFDAADRAVFDAINRPYALDRLPLVRTVLARIRDDEYLWGLGFHHIVTDWITAITFEIELATLYRADAAGREPDLPPLPVQMADYAVWQRQRLAGGALDAHAEYWRDKLRGAPPHTVVPLDRPRAGFLAGHGRRYHFRLSEDIAEGLRNLVRREGTTLFMAALALLKVTLLRLTGQTRLVVGSPVSSRSHPELEHVLGYLIHHLPFDTDLGDDPSFRQALGRERRTVLDAFAHKDLPFSRVVEAVDPPRDLERMPLSQITLLFLAPHEVGERALPGLEGIPHTFDGECSKFDFTFTLWDTPELRGMVEHNASLFDLSTIAQLVDAYRQLLEGALADPDRPLSGLALLSPIAERQIVEEPSTMLAAEVSTRQVAAPDETLEALAAIWRDVLELDATTPLAADADFFALGGVSVDLLRVRWRLATETGRDLSLLDLLRHHRLGLLAARLAIIPPNA